MYFVIFFERKQYYQPRARPGNWGEEQMGTQRPGDLHFFCGTKNNYACFKDVQLSASG